MSSWATGGCWWCRRRDGARASSTFIATKLLREAGMGPALLVSPLLALMRNQIAAAERMGVRAETINSDNSERWREVEAAISRDEVDIVLIAPERFANQRFNNQVLSQIGGAVSLLVVDEAHCISDWGHDFRPDYRRIERILRLLPPNLRMLATTATTNNRVMEDLGDILGPAVGDQPRRPRSSFSRTADHANARSGGTARLAFRSPS